MNEEYMKQMEEMMRRVVREEMERVGVKRGVGRIGGVERMYRGRALHYFVVSLDRLIEEGMEEEVEKIMEVLEDEEKFPMENDLARSIKEWVMESREMVMWAPNEKYCIVGHNRIGEKTRGEREKFMIPLEMMEDMGHYSDKSGVKERVKMAERVRGWMEEEKSEKMWEKVNRMRGGV
jgi:hypothetical protein